MTAVRKSLDSRLEAERRRVWRRKRLWEAGIITGLGLVIFALTGCGAAGEGGWGSPELVDAIGGLGAAAGNAGAMSGNPILFVLGTALSTFAAWRRLKAGGTPPIPPTAPPT